VKEGIGRDGDRRHRGDVAGVEREHARVLDVQYLHDRNAARDGAVDQGLHAADETIRVSPIPIGTMTK
jgi:hypothetical protein